MNQNQDKKNIQDKRIIEILRKIDNRSFSSKTDYKNNNIIFTVFNNKNQSDYQIIINESGLIVNEKFNKIQKIKNELIIKLLDSLSDVINSLIYKLDNIHNSLFEESMNQLDKKEVSINYFKFH